MEGQKITTDHFPKIKPGNVSSAEFAMGFEVGN